MRNDQAHLRRFFVRLLFTLTYPHTFDIIMAPKEAVKKVVKGGKAAKASAALKKGSGRKAARIHTKVHFYKPKTLKLGRSPKGNLKTAQELKAVKKLDVIKFPLTTETAMKKVNEDNTLVFIVDLKANKKQIKAAIKKNYDIVAAKVNTLIRPDGQKKAYVKLTADYDSLDVANKIGIL
jgi:large subunit ribosomal protein L23Ae